MKKYEIVLVDMLDGVKTEEYDTMEQMQDYLQEFVEYADDYLEKIEINIVERDEDFGYYVNSWCICEINMNEYRRGAKL